MAAPGSLLRLSRVSKSFRSVEGGPELNVLRNIDLEINAGESISIVGPSGCGKSTLLNIMGTLDRPSSGKVHLRESDLSELSNDDLAHVRNEQIGFVFQSHHLLPQCTVMENVLVPTLAEKNSGRSAGAGERARLLLNRVGLGERLDHRPGQLSGGERQRVAVVRALINRPALLLADEPTGALDSASSRELGKLLTDLNREQQITLVVVTHSTELAQQMARQLVLRQGELVT